MLIAVVGGLWAAFKYLRDKKEALAKERTLREQAIQTARTESQKPFSAKQQQVYFDLLDTTSLISNLITDANNDPRRKKAIQHFWVLFWGALPLVADEQVSIAADKFSVALDDPMDFVPLRNASMDLARACRKALGDSWSIGFEQFDKTDAMTAKELTIGELREVGSQANGTWLAKNLLHLLGTGLEDTITVAEIRFSEDKFSYSGTNYTRRGEQCGQFKSEPILLEKTRLAFLYDNSSSVTAHFAKGITTINFSSLKGGVWKKYQATAKDSVRKADITIQGYRADLDQCRKLESGRPEDEREVIMQFIDRFRNDIWVS